MDITKEDIVELTKVIKDFEELFKHHALTYIMANEKANGMMKDVSASDKLNKKQNLEELRLLKHIDETLTTIDDKI